MDNSEIEVLASAAKAWGDAKILKICEIALGIEQGALSASHARSMCEDIVACGYLGPDPEAGEQDETTAEDWTRTV